MKYVLPLLLLWPFFLSTNSSADDVFWVELMPYFSYRDDILSCGDRTGYLTSLFFMARLNDSGQVTWAEIRETNMPHPLKRLVFTAGEVAQIKVEKELLGDYSLKTLPMSSRVATWILFNADWRVGSILTNSGLAGFGSTAGRCAPTNYLATMSPQWVVMNFARKESNRFFAPTVKMTGTKVDGSPYEAKLGFWQKMLMNP